LGQRGRAQEQELLGVRQSYEEQLGKLIEASQRVEAAMQAAREQASSEAREEAAALREELGGARGQLEEAVRNLRGREEQVEALEESLAQSRDWGTRARLALRLLGEAALSANQRVAQLCEHKRVLSDQARAWARLQSDVLALALAVSGDHLLTLPRPPPALRAVVVAVLFANRLCVPSFRRRLALLPPLQEEPTSLPSRDELQGLDPSRAASRVLRCLCVRDQEHDQAPAGGPSGMLGSRSLLDNLVRGQRAHSRRLADTPMIHERGYGVKRGDRWDPSGRWATQAIRGGFLAMGRSLALMGDKAGELRLEKVALEARLEEQQRRGDLLEQDLRQARGLLADLQERLAALQAEKGQMLSRAEADSTLAALQAAQARGEAAVTRNFALPNLP
jgi:hypothetical protein